MSKNITEKILRAQSFDVTSVRSGEEACKAAQKGDFDLVLMDIQLPKMDGMACAEKLRANDSIPSSVPIVALTGNDKEYTRDDFQASGIDDYLVKPFDFTDLIRKIHQHTHA